MSSLLWLPSEQTDRYRFTEIVARVPRNGLDPTRVSAPLLAEDFPLLRQALQISEISWYLKEAADKSEAEALGICTAASLRDCKKTIRQYSYASLLYKQVRCGFTHEYQPGKKATDSDALRGISGVGTNCISYVNQIGPVEIGSVARRVIHFPIEWISAVAQAVASGMDRECAIQSKVIFENLGLSIPQVWWSNGGS